MKSMTSRLVGPVLAAIGIILLPFSLIYFVPLEKIDFETLIPVVSIVAGGVSLLAVASDLRSPKPARPRTITITIDDTAGGIVRLVAQSDRSVSELRRDIDQLLHNETSFRS
jgi:hypothetical protein